MDNYFKDGKLNFELINLKVEKQQTLLGKLIELEGIVDKINSQSKKQITVHTIMDEIEEIQFKDNLKNPELTFWFLKYNARNYLNEILTEHDFRKVLKSRRAKIRLQVLLDEIKAEEAKYEDLLKEGVVDDLKGYRKKGFLHFSESIIDDKDDQEVDYIRAKEYLRVTDNYYEDNPTECSYWVFKSPEVKAYCRHNLLKPYLERKIGIKHSGVNKQKLSMKQIALVHFYSQNQITRENGTELAKKYGHNSGDKIYQWYSFYSSRTNRIGKPLPFTPKKLLNKIQLFESVIDLVPENKKQQLINEISTLKALLENEW